MDLSSIVTIENVKKVAKVAVPIAAGAVGLKAISIAKEKSKAKKTIAVGEPIVNSMATKHTEKKIKKLEARLDKLKRKQKLPAEQPSSEKSEEEEIQEQLLELGGANE